MSRIGNKSSAPLVSILVTDYGDWPCPKDLIDLYRVAIAAGISQMRDPWEPGGPKYHVPSSGTPEGKAYYAREREYVKAIDLIESTGTLRVVTAEPSPKARERELQMEST